MKDKIIIGSRESRLAVIQAEMVQDYLQKMLPQKTIEILTMKTTGDKILNQALERAGGKGLFVKELDYALLEKRSDLSVHSLKDVPTELPEELPLLAFSRREDPRDALILPEGATEIDFSRPVGCSSKRRMVQFQKLYPQAKFETIRGNVQGVGFRAFIERQAQERALDGWVRNRLDGSVELLAVGDAAALDQLTEACRRGPVGARVEAVVAEPAEGITPARFEVKPTV